MMTGLRPAERLAARELYYERFTRQPLFESYGTARHGTREDAIRLLSRDLTRTETPRALAAEGVRYASSTTTCIGRKALRRPRHHRSSAFGGSLGPVRIFELDARPLNLDLLLAKAGEEIGLLWGLDPLVVRMTNGRVQRRRAIFRVPLRVALDAPGRNVAHQESRRRPGDDNHRRLRIREQEEGHSATGRSTNEDGTTLASTRVPIVLSEFQLGPFEVPAGTSRITLAAIPGPTPFGDKRNRFLSIFLSPLRAPQVPDYTKRLSATRTPEDFLRVRQTAHPFEMNPRLGIFVREYRRARGRLRHAATILDVGCGREPSLAPFMEAEDAYHGVDFYDERPVGITEYTQLDLNRNRLSEAVGTEAFDVVFCGEVIEHLFSPDALMHELEPCLRTDGDPRALVAEPWVLAEPTPAPRRHLTALPGELSRGETRPRSRRLGQGNPTEGHIRLFTYRRLRELVERSATDSRASHPPMCGAFLPTSSSRGFSRSLAAKNVFVLAARLIRARRPLAVRPRRRPPCAPS